MIEAAQTHYCRGARFFESGQYDAALVEFEAAWRLSGSRTFCTNLSWTHEKAGRIKEAIEYAVRYQAAAQTVEDQERATQAGGISEAAVCQRCDRTDDRAQLTDQSRAGPTAAQRAPKRTQPGPRAAKDGSQHKVPPPLNRAVCGRWSAGAGWYRLFGWGVVHVAASWQHGSDVCRGLCAEQSRARAECDRHCADSGWWCSGCRRAVMWAVLASIGTNDGLSTPFKEVLSDEARRKRKAIGYLSYFARRQSLFVVPMQEEELADIADELTARGMEVYWDHSKEDRGHRRDHRTVQAAPSEVLLPQAATVLSPDSVEHAAIVRGRPTCHRELPPQ